MLLIIVPSFCITASILASSKRLSGQNKLWIFYGATCIIRKISGVIGLRMPMQVSYMGTKRQLATTVADIVSQCQDGPLLDLFSGMCSVGAAVSQERQVWNNDAQIYASTVARAFFASKDNPLGREKIAELALPHFKKNFTALEKKYSRLLAKEATLLSVKDHEALGEFNNQLPHVGNDQNLSAERAKLALKPTTFPYRLFSITFAGGYLSLGQCMELDSLRYAIDRLSESKLLTKDQQNWALLALSQAMCKCSTTSGHFAQYIKIKQSNSGVFLRQRNKKIWTEWLNAANAFTPLRDKEWRKSNLVFNGDAETLLEKLNAKSGVPSVIYADPPYTEDQYSRYYHVYETLMLYDYPVSSGIGRYRDDRFRSRFSLRKSVPEAFENLVSGAARLGCHLVISYPENDLIKDTKKTVLSILNKHFNKSEVAEEISHKHSSLGNSKGIAKYNVNELIFYAR